MTTPSFVDAAAEEAAGEVPSGGRPQGRRRRVASVLAGVVAVAAGALVVVQAPEDDPDLVVGDAGPSLATTAVGGDAPTNRPVSIAIQREADGGQRVVFTFEAPLPDSPPQAVAGIGSVPRELDGVVYTTQEGGPDAVIHQCDTRHFGFSPIPLETGSVDVFFPAAWMPPGFDPSTDVPIDASESTGKFVGCGPHEGYVQYSAWEPPSDDLRDVSADVTGSTLIVEIRP